MGRHETNALPKTTDTALWSSKGAQNIKGFMMTLCCNLNHHICAKVTSLERAEQEAPCLCLS